MHMQADAVYENGVLKLDQPLPLEQGARVRIEVVSKTSLAQESLGMVPWSGDAKSLETLALDHDLDLHECR